MRESRHVAFAAVLAVAWASAGGLPFVETLRGAPAPIDFARDYVAAHAHLHDAPGALAGRGPENSYARSIGVPEVVLLDGPYYAHPPTTTLLVLPFATLSFERAALGWFVLSLAALAVLALALARMATRTNRPRAGVFGAVFVLLALWPPVLHNLAKGQWSILLAALIAAGWDQLSGGRPRTAGVLIGLAASLKATPVLLLGYLAMRHRRAAWTMAATLGGTALVSLALFGVEPWRAFISGARPNALTWQTWTANTVSLNGLYARLFAGGAFARPLFTAPGLAQALTVGTTLALVAMAIRTTWREPVAGDDRRLFAAWMALVVLANPLGWTHTAVMALGPLALVDGAPAWARASVLVALTVPRETLAALAGPLPVTPGRGLALSVHALALLALVALALRRAAPASDRAPVA